MYGVCSHAVLFRKGAHEIDLRDVSSFVRVCYYNPPPSNVNYLTCIPRPYGEYN